MTKCEIETASREIDSAVLVLISGIDLSDKHRVALGRIENQTRLILDDVTKSAVRIAELEAEKNQLNGIIEMMHEANQEVLTILRTKPEVLEWLVAELGDSLNLAVE